ncbi:hypothetical protein ABEB36_006524 [Hypothenemus hampei]|uniref:RIIa domain-containing protein n=1 Tax=Hypothenemus hampei TaxID=57062 RepID=A0ABD1ERA8_HYPHA
MKSSRIKTDSGSFEMIVKRVSVPVGLEELMEGLTKEVLLKKPKDLCVFAAEYFSRLILLREQNPKAYPSIRTVQSVIKQKPIDQKSADKRLTRQYSIRSRQKAKKEELAKDKEDSARSLKNKTPISDRKNPIKRATSLQRSRQTKTVVRQNSFDTIRNGKSEEKSSESSSKSSASRNVSSIKPTSSEKSNEFEKPNKNNIHLMKDRKREKIATDNVVSMTMEPMNGSEEVLIVSINENPKEIESVQSEVIEATAPEERKQFFRSNEELVLEKIHEINADTFPRDLLHTFLTNEQHHVFKFKEHPNTATTKISSLHDVKMASLDNTEDTSSSKSLQLIIVENDLSETKDETEDIVSLTEDVRTSRIEDDTKDKESVTISTIEDENTVGFNKENTFIKDYEETVVSTKRFLENEQQNFFVHMKKSTLKNIKQHSVSHCSEFQGTKPVVQRTKSVEAIKTEHQQVPKHTLFASGNKQTELGKSVGKSSNGKNDALIAKANLENISNTGQLQVEEDIEKKIIEIETGKNSKTETKPHIDVESKEIIKNDSNPPKVDFEIEEIKKLSEEKNVDVEGYLKTSPLNEVEPKDIRKKSVESTKGVTELEINGNQHDALITKKNLKDGSGVDQLNVEQDVKKKITEVETGMNSKTEIKSHIKAESKQKIPLELEENKKSNQEKVVGVANNLKSSKNSLELKDTGKKSVESTNDVTEPDINKNQHNALIAKKTLKDVSHIDQLKVEQDVEKQMIEVETEMDSKIETKSHINAESIQKIPLEVEEHKKLNEKKVVGVANNLNKLENELELKATEKKNVESTNDVTDLEINENQPDALITKNNLKDVSSVYQLKVEEDVGNKIAKVKTDMNSKPETKTDINAESKEKVLLGVEENKKSNEEKVIDVSNNSKKSENELELKDTEKKSVELTNDITESEINKNQNDALIAKENMKRNSSMDQLKVEEDVGNKMAEVKTDMNSKSKAKTDINADPRQKVLLEVEKNNKINEEKTVGVANNFEKSENELNLKETAKKTVKSTNDVTESDINKNQNDALIAKENLKDVSSVDQLKVEKDVGNKIEVKTDMNSKPETKIDINAESKQKGHLKFEKNNKLNEKKVVADAKNIKKSENELKLKNTTENSVESTNEPVEFGMNKNQTKFVNNLLEEPTHAVTAEHASKNKVQSSKNTVQLKEPEKSVFKATNDAAEIEAKIQTKADIVDQSSEVQPTNIESKEKYMEKAKLDVQPSRPSTKVDELIMKAADDPEIVVSKTNEKFVNGVKPTTKVLQIENGLKIAGGSLDSVTKYVKKYENVKDGSENKNALEPTLKAVESETNLKIENKSIEKVVDRENKNNAAANVTGEDIKSMVKSNANDNDGNKICNEGVEIGTETLKLVDGIDKHRSTVETHSEEMTAPEKDSKFNDNNEQSMRSNQPVLKTEVIDTTAVESERAAIKIQSIWKGFIVRKLLKQTKRQQEAIVRIQSVVRGYLDRLKYSKLKKENALKMDSAKKVSEGENQLKEDSNKMTIVLDKNIQNLDTSVKEENLSNAPNNEVTFCGTKETESKSDNDKNRNKIHKKLSTVEADKISDIDDLDKEKNLYPKEVIIAKQQKEELLSKSLEVPVPESQSPTVTLSNKQNATEIENKTKSTEKDLASENGQSFSDFSKEHIADDPYHNRNKRDTNNHESTHLETKQILEINNEMEQNKKSADDVTVTIADSIEQTGRMSRHVTEKDLIQNKEECKDIVSGTNAKIVHKINEPKKSKDTRNDSESISKESNLHDHVVDNQRLNEENKPELSIDKIDNQHKIENKISEAMNVKIGASMADMNSKKDEVTDGTFIKPESIETESQMKISQPKVKDSDKETNKTEVEIFSKTSPIIEEIVPNKVNIPLTNEVVEKSTLVENKNYLSGNGLKEEETPKEPKSNLNEEKVSTVPVKTDFKQSDIKHEIPVTEQSDRIDTPLIEEITDKNNNNPTKEETDFEKDVRSSIEEVIKQTKALDAKPNDSSEELTSSVDSTDSVVTIIANPSSKSALENHVELLDQVQNSLLDQLSGKISKNQFNEVVDKIDLGPEPVPDVMEFLYDFEPEIRPTVASRELPDIAEEIDEASEIVIGNDKIDVVYSSDDGRLKHTSEFHDTVVVPLAQGTNVTITNKASKSQPIDVREEVDDAAPHGPPGQVFVIIVSEF